MSTEFLYILSQRLYSHRGSLIVSSSWYSWWNQGLSALIFLLEGIVE